MATINNNNTGVGEEEEKLGSLCAADANSKMVQLLWKTRQWHDITVSNEREKSRAKSTLPTKAFIQI